MQCIMYRYGANMVSMRCMMLSLLSSRRSHVRYALFF